MNGDAYTPGPGWPTREQLEYWSAFATVLLLSLGVPYLVLQFFRNPGKAVSLTGRV